VHGKWFENRQDILTVDKREVAQIGASSDADGVCHLPHHWQQTTGNLRHYYRVNLMYIGPCIIVIVEE